MKNIYTILIIFLVTACNEKNYVTEKVDSKGTAPLNPQYVPKDGAIDAKTMDLNPEGLFCLKGSDIPYTGKTYSLRSNGNIEAEGNMKNGKPDGLIVEWHNNGQKKIEQIFKSGELLSEKFWDKKGQPLQNYDETEG